jgi:hypothetical protein
MRFGSPDAFGSRNGARIYLDQDQLEAMRKPGSVARVHEIRDRFSLKQIPIIYYNAKFGAPLQADDDTLADWRQKDFRAVTEFQLYTHGIQLDAAQRAGFERGDWIAIVPAHEDEGKKGPPDQGLIVGTLRTALYAQCVRASRVLQMAQFQANRDANPWTRADETVRDQLENAELATVKAAFKEASDQYAAPEIRKKHERNVTTDHLRTAGRNNVTSWFGLTPEEIRAQAATEILCHEQIYGPFSYNEIADRELPVISILRRGHLRALAVHRIERETARHRVAKSLPIGPGTRQRLDYGTEYDLNLWGCFMLALYGGINPVALYGEFEPLSDLFDLAAWFGYFARGAYHEMPPEIAVTLLSCFSTNPGHGVIEDDIPNLEKIYKQVDYLADLLVGHEPLMKAAKKAIATRAAVKIAPLYYSTVVSSDSQEPDSPDATIDPRFYVGMGQNGINLSVDFANVPEMTHGERLLIRHFRPLLW